MLNMAGVTAAEESTRFRSINHIYKDVSRNWVICGEEPGGVSAIGPIIIVPLWMRSQCGQL